MRALSAVVLSCVLALGMSGSLMAGGLDVPNAQLLINTAKKATTGVPTDVELTLDDGKKVVFTVFRDAVGNVSARPKAGQDTKGITITQVNIQMGANASGILTPVSMVVQESGSTSLTKHTIVFNSDGTIKSLDQPNVVQSTQVTGGLGTPTSTLNGAKTPDPFANPFLSVNNGGQLPLPAGAESGQLSGSVP